MLTVKNMVYTENGGIIVNKRKYIYVKGKYHGLYRLWHDNSELWEEYTYNNGMRI